MPAVNELKSLAVIECERKGTITPLLGKIVISGQIAIQCPQRIQVFDISPVSMVIALAGQSLTHFRHLVHLLNSILGMMIGLRFQKYSMFCVSNQKIYIICGRNLYLRRITYSDTGRNVNSENL